jgi:hypothetical protein
VSSFLEETGGSSYLSSEVSNDLLMIPRFGLSQIWEPRDSGQTTETDTAKTCEYSIGPTSY